MSPISVGQDRDRQFGREGSGAIGITVPGDAVPTGTLKHDEIDVAVRVHVGREGASFAIAVGQGVDEVLSGRVESACAVVSEPGKLVDVGARHTDDIGIAVAVEIRRREVGEAEAVPDDRARAEVPLTVVRIPDADDEVPGEQVQIAVLVHVRQFDTARDSPAGRRRSPAPTRTSPPHRGSRASRPRTRCSFRREPTRSRSPSPSRSPATTSIPYPSLVEMIRCEPKGIGAAWAAPAAPRRMAASQQIAYRTERRFDRSAFFKSAPCGFPSTATPGCEQSAPRRSSESLRRRNPSTRKSRPKEPKSLEKRAERPSQRQSPAATKAAQ